uniref:Uncharacterized protein n=1 Tax=viral metagenome TaxID=1070528 RepID=A0A6M3X5P1_9ZZZZ
MNIKEMKFIKRLFCKNHIWAHYIGKDSLNYVGICLNCGKKLKSGKKLKKGGC